MDPQLRDAVLCPVRPVLVHSAKWAANAGRLHLLHLFVIQAIGHLAIALRLNATTAGLSITMACMFLGSVAAATEFHLIVERPLTRRLRIYAGIERPLVGDLTSRLSALKDVAP